MDVTRDVFGTLLPSILRVWLLTAYLLTFMIPPHLLPPREQSQLMVLRCVMHVFPPVPILEAEGKQTLSFCVLCVISFPTWRCEKSLL